MAKKFFYLCAGLLMLAAAYQLGVRNASAHSGLVSAVGFDSNAYVYSAVVGHTLYYLSSSRASVRIAGTDAIPGSGTVIACNANNGVLHAMLDNGDCYSRQISFGGDSWRLDGNIFGGAVTPAQSSSWGALKVKTR